MTDIKAKELPVLPEPEYRLSPDSEPSLYDPYDMQAYGATCAAHARELALNEAMEVMGKQDTWLTNCAAYRLIEALKKAGK